MVIPIYKVLLYFVIIFTKTSAAKFTQSDLNLRRGGGGGVQCTCADTLVNSNQMTKGDRKKLLELASFPGHFLQGRTSL